MQTGDWIDKLFSDDLVSFKSYLHGQMEFITFQTRREYWDYWQRIQTGDKKKLMKIADEFKELLPVRDPAKQFNERNKIQ